jgi:hypothetical protein
VAKHLLLFAATTGYQIRVFVDTARRLGVDVTLATDRCHIIHNVTIPNLVRSKSLRNGLTAAWILTVVCRPERRMYRCGP